MKNIRICLSENFHFLTVKFSVYLNSHVFVMRAKCLLIHSKSISEFSKEEKKIVLLFLNLNTLRANKQTTN